ncbi:hypothetical protein E1283_06435 [Streptomyces hainanensis]|uniref:Uncharacterized protein n=1 Tax=Streptomyces hainanensis TaxID=402648 RepID=A0A4R4TRK0_9ACTN|nr:hypothetical protein E1283_06435 [Streptomyces hainanensis]
MAEPDGDAPTPEVGAMARDSTADRVGRVMAYECGLVWLRPLGGGREWTAPLERVRPVGLGESLSPLVAEANRRSGCRNGYP